MTEDESGPLTVAETARLLQRSTEQVRRYLREGVLPGRRVGGQWFIDARAVATFRQRRRAQADFLHRLANDDADPLRDVIGIGGSGGADIAAGWGEYMASFARGRE